MRMVLTIAALAAGVVTQAAAAEPKEIATSRDWVVYTLETGGDRICYAASRPKEKAPSSVNHGDVYFMIATWKSGAATEQPNFLAGYDLKDKPAPTVRIGSDRWSMFASGTEGFIEVARDEARLVAAMKRGSDMRLSATSVRGTATEYTFSLLGFSGALERMTTACK